MELYREVRPQTFKQVIGQSAAVQALTEMGKKGEIPHVLLFTGPSGVGKTTLARIVAGKLNCEGTDFQEINGADNRKIEDIRNIKNQLGAAPLRNGGVRIWLIDEAHALTPDAQTCLLKVLEDTPKHVYFILATTDPQKLKNTIRTRCTQIDCKPLKKADLVKLVQRTAKQKDVKISDTVAKAIAEAADSSARMSLVMLHKVLYLEKEEDQLALIDKEDGMKGAFDLARALHDTRSDWNKVSAILADVIDDQEGVRRVVLGFANSVVLKNQNPGRTEQALRIIDEFQYDFFQSGKAGLTRACWNSVH